MSFSRSLPWVPVTCIGLCASSARCSAPVQKHLQFLSLQPLLGAKAFQPMLVNAVTHQGDGPLQTEERWGSRVRLARAASRKAAVLSLSWRWIIWCWKGPWCASKSRKLNLFWLHSSSGMINTRLHTNTWQQQVAVRSFFVVVVVSCHKSTATVVSLYSWISLYFYLSGPYIKRHR